MFTKYLHHRDANEFLEVPIKKLAHTRELTKTEEPILEDLYFFEGAADALPLLLVSFFEELKLADPSVFKLKGSPLNLFLEQKFPASVESFL